MFAAQPKKYKMTPKEKAIELYDKYFFHHYVWQNDGYQVDEKLTYEVTKRFALIAVDEILKAVNNPDETYLMKHFVSYWTEVKQQLKNL